MSGTSKRVSFDFPNFPVPQKFTQPPYEWY